mmetsp:Transcript_34549/g.97443  ORF Transcript_34549/g.97443 Transcript_34549/m.97443 type:complete len:274 (-) Transcript_34549:850-1671(-)
MLKKIRSGRPFLRIAFQCLGDKVRNLFGPLGRILDGFWDALRAAVVKGAERVLVVGRVAIDDLQDGNGKGPDIDGFPVGLELDHLRGDPEGGTEDVDDPAARRGLGEAKVDELDLAVLGEHDVLALQVAVGDVDVVEVLQGAEDGTADVGDVGFLEVVVHDGLGEGPALHHLHDDPQLVPPQVAAKVAHDVLVLCARDEPELVQVVLLVVFRLVGHLLNGHVGALLQLPVLVDHQGVEHAPEAPPPDHAADLVQTVRVDVFDDQILLLFDGVL